MNRPTTPAREAPNKAAHHRRWSVPIGRVFGIELRVHASFVLIVVVFWLGSTGPGGLGVANGMIWLALIFACVTAHELSHSLVARSKGVGVRAIVLLPIGGVSELEEMPQDPNAEFGISVVGPLTSLGIAGLAFLFAGAAGNALFPPNLYDGALLPRLAWLNLLLGGFNLLPAFPMDGGRVFRALLERRYSLEEATHRAATAGRRFAIAMAIVGVLVNFWLVFIGLFVYFGASAEESATILHVRLSGLTVGDAMLHDPGLAEELAVTVPVLGPADPLEEVGVPAIAAAPEGMVPVFSEGQPVGVLTADAVRRLLRTAPVRPAA